MEWGNKTGREFSRRARTRVIVGAAVVTMVAAFAPVAAHAAAPITGLAQVSAGASHTCAVTTGGAAKCWGINAKGELGNGTTTQNASPQPVTGLTSGVTMISAGADHTCAVVTANVWCWGFNNHGQVGNGGTSLTNGVLAPSKVVSTHFSGGVTQVVTGSEFSCALTTGGAVYCWGSGDNGQLGYGVNTQASTSRFLPSAVVGLTSGVTAIAASGKHACAITAAGGLECWGLNQYGEIGDGTTTGPNTCTGLPCSNVPVAVTGLSSGVSAIALGGQDSCALLGDGSVKCWGADESGELGNNSVTTESTPVSVNGLSSGVTAIAAGGATTCAINSGALECWGLNSHGQVGDGTLANRLVPVAVPGASSNVTGIDLGTDHSCLAVTVSATTTWKCWGDNQNGQLGDGTLVDLAGPFVSDPPQVPSAVAGDNNAVVSWTAPSYSGGSTISNYAVTSSPGGIVTNVDGSQLSAEVDGLTNGTAYTFTVAATNAVGVSHPSVATAPVTPAGPPGAPTGVVVAPGDGEATVSWHPAPNNGSVVLTYSIVASPGGETVSTNRLLQATLTGLKNGAQYSFSIRARNRVGTGPAASVTQRLPIPKSGYWMLGADGKVYAFGNTVHYGDAHGQAVALAARRDGLGYWVVDRAGDVSAFGKSRVYGPRPALRPGEYVSTISATPSGNGYLLFTSKGRAFPYGDAHFYGDMSAVTLNGPVIASVATPTGKGYYMVASDGGVFSFGDAAFHGSTGNIHLNKPVVGLSPTPDNRGYWLVASDGGVFAFGGPFRGSLGSIKLNKPVNGLVAFGNGYLMVASDGGVFDFSNRPFVGSLGANPPSAPIIGIAAFISD